MNISSSMANPVELSGKALDYIIKQACDNGSSEEAIRKAISLTLEQVDIVSRKKLRTEALVASSFHEQRELASRISFFRAVGLNTFRKMTHGHPADLNWLYSRGRIHVVGVFRPVHSFRDKNPMSDITDQVVSGSKIVESSDVIRFYVTALNGNFLTVELPVNLLRNDPMIVAQKVRKECRAYAEKQYNSRNDDISRRIAELERNYKSDLEKLQNESTNKNSAKPMKSPFSAKPVRPRRPGL